MGYRLYREFHRVYRDNGNLKRKGKPLFRVQGLGFRDMKGCKGMAASSAMAVTFKSCLTSGLSLPGQPFEQVLVRV